ncbi:MAG: lysophospholipid acyltransferase family protein [Hyphomicrobiaceae bacterium]
MIRGIRGSAILALFLLMTLPLMPVQALLIALGSPLARHLPTWYHRRVCRLLGIRIRVTGQLQAGRPLLVVANHVSWLDIPVMSTLGPVSFIAKREVGTWPFIGWLARLQRTAFVDRDRRSAARDQAGEIARRLAAGDTMILFPEGTTGDGNRLLPFKSTLLGAAVPGRGDRMVAAEGSPGRAAALADLAVPDRPLVQTLAIAYTHVHGMPIGRMLRPVFAWYGDMDVPGHAFEVLKSGPIDVRIAIGEPVALDTIPDRKVLARYAESRIASDFARLLRLEEPLPPHVDPERHGAAAGLYVARGRE